MKNQNLSRSLGIAIALYALTCFPPFGGTKGGCQSVGINPAGSLPNSSAGLDVDFTNKGLLIPRVGLTSTTDAATIASPATSLLVYNTNAAMTGGSVGYWYWDGAQWVQFGTGGGGGTAWELLGNAGTIDGTHFLGTTDNKPLNFRVNNQKAGRIDPTLFNTFLGYQAGNTNTTGYSNTAIGHLALYANTTGNWNTATGDSALGSNTTGLQNTATGESALRYNTIGSYNTATGNNALYSNTTGGYNTATGTNALRLNTTGDYNTATGYWALRLNTIGTTNTAMGYQALRANVSGRSNTAAGKDALLNNNTGSWNTASGDSAGYANTTGTLNTYLGYQANGSATLTNATAIGANALVTASNSLVLGNSVNVGIGTTAPSTRLHVEDIWRTPNAASGYSNIAVYSTDNQAVDRGGSIALGGMIDNGITRGNFGIIGGYKENSTSGDYLGYLGFYTGPGAFGIMTERVRISSAGNVGIGTTTPGAKLEVVGASGTTIKIVDGNQAAGKVLTSDAAGQGSWQPAGGGGGSGWLLIGNTGTTPGTNFLGTTDNVPMQLRVNNIQAGLVDNTNRTTFFGYEAGLNNSGATWNTAVGYEALKANTTGIYNTAFGYGTLRSNTIGAANTSFGRSALASNTIGTNNTAIGNTALYYNTTGLSNTALGWSALTANSTGNYNTATGYGALFSNLTGNYNTATGYGALSTNETGDYNTAIGYNPFLPLTSYFNTTILGASTSVSADNMVRVGSTAVTSIGGQVGWTTVSDRRIKNNVQENVPGLTFIKELRPVTYYYDIDKQNELLGTKDTSHWNGKDKIKKMQFSGFIAQEVEAAAQRVGYNFSGVDKNGTLWGLRYAEFVVPLVKGMQEQQELINNLQIDNRTLKEENSTILNEVKNLKMEMEKVKQQLGVEAKRSISNN